MNIVNLFLENFWNKKVTYRHLLDFIIENKFSVSQISFLLDKLIEKNIATIEMKENIIELFKRVSSVKTWEEWNSDMILV